VAASGFWAAVGLSRSRLIGAHGHTVSRRGDFDGCSRVRGDRRGIKIEFLLFCVWIAPSARPRWTVRRVSFRLFLKKEKIGYDDQLAWRFCCCDGDCILSVTVANDDAARQEVRLKSDVN